MIHIPVLLDEVIDIFKTVESGVIVDCTLGYAGHTKALLESNKNIKMICFDRDIEAINHSKKALSEFSDRVEIHHTNFANMVHNIDVSEVRGVLADIGVSSLHLDKDDRGFSINSQNLDMRMDKSQELDAKFVVNNYSLDELTRVLREFGELKDAKFIASEIVKHREQRPILTGKELSDIVGKKSVRKNSASKATLVFQAIRIEVNKELDELTNLLTSIENAKFHNTIVAIISFHSLEDRMVKNKFKEWERSCICPEFVMKCECGNNHQKGKIITKKPLTASASEIKENSRSKPAKLRAFWIE
ncbi:MAG: 16S rRNA (cytosine(1402)-N(4))-methyltransferase RsmH [Campylobacteraceae bacterium]|nr:16S rRNA (cytosine(1402)-N(4))-methyltransferase RsmH [Campylobacteraceae bacterium]